MKKIFYAVIITFLIFSLSAQAKTMTMKEVKEFNGKNGKKAYIVVDNVVYDVTNVKSWKNGKHKMGIVAGSDVTKFLSRSPHGASVLNNLKIVGKIKGRGK